MTTCEASEGRFSRIDAFDKPVVTRALHDVISRFNVLDTFSQRFLKYGLEFIVTLPRLCDNITIIVFNNVIDTYSVSPKKL